MRLAQELKKVSYYTRWIARNSKPFTGCILLILFLDAFSSLSGVAVAILSKNLIDNAVSGFMGKVIVFAVIFGGLVIINLGVRALLSVISVKTGELMSNRMRTELYAGLCSTEWIYVSKYHSGDTLTRLTSDINNVTSGVINTLPSVISLGLQLTAAFGTLLYYEPVLAVLAFVLGPVTVIFSRIWGWKLKQLHVKVQETESAYRSFIQESIENILIVKTFRMEKQSRESLNGLHNERMKWIIRRNRTSVAAGTMLGLGYWAGYFLAFCWGALKLSAGKTTFGTLTAFLQLVEQVQGPFIGLSGTLPQIIAAFGSAGRLIELETLPQEVAEGSQEVLNLHTYLTHNSSPVGISISGVTYSYPGGGAVLEDASLDIPPGETVALIGQSGEGKTTLIRIILALIRPDKGGVFFTDSSSGKSEASVITRDLLSYVPQGNTLFSGTITQNLAAGNCQATREEMEAALEAACASEFVNELPDGMNTFIGEKGIGLSEGQAQRIAIARALIRKKPVLILDEATSSLDIKTEMKVLQSLKKLQPQRTCIVITHRPSAANICSRILRLRNGRLVEEGTDGAWINCSESA